MRRPIVVALGLSLAVFVGLGACTPPKVTVGPVTSPAPPTSYGPPPYCDKGDKVEPCGHHPFKILPAYIGAREAFVYDSCQGLYWIGPIEWVWLPLPNQTGETDARCLWFLRDYP